MLKDVVVFDFFGNVLQDFMLKPFPLVQSLFSLQHASMKTKKYDFILTGCFSLLFLASKVNIKRHPLMMPIIIVPNKL